MTRGKHSSSVVTKAREELEFFRGRLRALEGELATMTRLRDEWYSAYMLLREQGQPEVAGAERQVAELKERHAKEVDVLAGRFDRVFAIFTEGIQPDGTFALTASLWDELAMLDVADYVATGIKGSVSNSSRQTRRNIERNVGNVVGLGD